MIQARLSEIAGWLGVAPPPCGKAAIHGVSTDTRRLTPGSLFVALPGTRCDGHQFAAEAEAKGASALMVEHDVVSRLPQIVVADTVAGLGALACAWRERFNLQSIAIAGSNGKTTVKDMLGAILRRAHPSKALITQGNLNNHIGVPLTLLRLGSRHRFAVIELGTNRFGAIGTLSNLARPAVGVITNAGLDHLAGFGGPEGAARANGEMFAEMGRDGIAVLPASDPCLPIWLSMAVGHRVVTFGFEARAEVRGAWQATGFGGMLEVMSPWGKLAVEVPLLGQHNGFNALAAVTVALVLGLQPAVIADALAGLKASPGRMQLRRGASGLRIIDDSYNANPSSFAAAIEVLAEADGEKVLVIGDMAELGDSAASWHTRVGENARAAGLDALYAVGDLSRHAARAFGAGGQHFPTRRELIGALQAFQRHGVTILVKGSRRMYMDQVVGALLKQRARRTSRAQKI